MKFGDVKAISSDMYFGKQDSSEVNNAQHAYTLSTWCAHCVYLVDGQYVVSC